MEIQTRSEIHGLKQHATLKDAIEHAQKEHTVWKISFSIETGERVRLVKNSYGEFFYESII